MQSQQFTQLQRKSLIIALLLELLCPGAGAIYTHKVRVGIAWLVTTVAGDGVFLTLMFISVFGYGGDAGGITFLVALLLGFALFLWLVVRLALADSYVKAFNEEAQRRRRRIPASKP